MLPRWRQCHVGNRELVDKRLIHKCRRNELGLDIDHCRRHGCIGQRNLYWRELDHFHIDDERVDNDIGGARLRGLR